MGASSQQIGVVLVAAGAVLVFAGLILRFGGFGWFGHLPGDIRIVRDTTKIYIPITSMLLVSVALSLVLTLLLWVIRFNR